MIIGTVCWRSTPLPSPVSVQTEPRCGWRVEPNPCHVTLLNPRTIMGIPLRVGDVIPVRQVGC